MAVARLSAQSVPTLYGDFSQYVITRRVGSSLELMPHRFGANRRPTGQRGA
jgi:predicted phage gp36 major capsid-like protein